MEKMGGDGRFRKPWETLRDSRGKGGDSGYSRAGRARGSRRE